ncbi:hypothetical protein DPMN_126852 [Dreissena polymorpha]|uniref:G-protein coupled receptors family 1 profile domain-containing protein n=1 Tax=Dreissena polymorpha TaxID=45954 RepID=A0A9D4JUB5_DREPO|nr:hypothetical protein DPMN_126852 [Dreissena polymorpha]
MNNSGTNSSEKRTSLEIAVIRIDELYSSGHFYTYIIWIFLALMCVFAVLVMQSTKRTTFNSRLYATCVCAFDSLCLAAFVLHQSCSGHFECNVYAIKLGISWKFMSVLVVMMMTTERLFAVLKPLHFLKYNTRTRVVTFTGVTLIFAYLFFWTHQGRFWYTGDSWTLAMEEFALQNVVLFIIPLFITMLVTMKLINVTRDQTRISTQGQTLRKSLGIIRRMSSSSLLRSQAVRLQFVQQLFRSGWVLCGVLFYIFILTQRLTLLNELEVLVALVTIDCAVNISIYVFWYKECRYVALGCITPFNRKLRERHRAMRYEIYDIVRVPTEICGIERVPSEICDIERVPTEICDIVRVPTEINNSIRGPTEISDIVRVPTEICDIVPVPTEINDSV